MQVDLYSGATRAYWIDSLSAYFPGLLTLAGEIEEAMSTHLLFAALWTRYSALPERWSVASGNVEGGLRWWGGRPEFIESTWYLYRATKDPWYIHVGEMTLKDIKRRCRVPCGWAGLHDVRTGEQTDRMESFFLGETIKYLFLLFTPQHPLNHWDAPFVFTTEGHPVIIPRRLRGNQGAKAGTGEVASQPPAKGFRCALPPSPLPLTVSTVAARKDLFHAASLARLHLVPTHNLATAASIEMTYDHPSMSVVDEQSPLNHSFYPWTLSNQLVPPDGISAIIATRSTFDLSFPTLPNTVGGPGTMSRVNNGVVLGSVSGLSLGLVRETIQADDRIGQPAMEHYRIFSVSNMEIGNDDTVYMSRKLIENFNPADPYFTRIKEWQSVHVIAEIGESQPALVKKLQAQIRGTISPDADAAANENDKLGSRNKTLVALPSSEAETLLDVLKRLIEGNAWSHERRRSIYAVTAVGVGSAPLPEVGDSSEDGDDRLPWTSIYFSDETCGPRLPFLVPREYQVIVMKRGGCSFTEKLEKIPAFPPSEGGLKLVIIVSYPHQEGEQDFAPAGGTGRPIRPLLEDIQHTMTGIPRHHPIPLILVSGGDQTYEYLKNSQAIGLRRSWNYYSQGLKIQNLLMV